MTKMLRSILLVLVASAAAHAGVIKVFVVDHQSGQPLAHTRVILQPLVRAGESAKELTVFTDRFGQYAFSNIDAGVYLLTAKKANYADARHGQKSWRQPGLPFTLIQDGEFVTQLRMHRLGVITGEVVDENRVGIPGVPVYAYHFSTHMKLAGKGESDDRGAFRIPGLPQGRYLIQSGSRQVDDRGLMPTFYGQTTRASDARTSDVLIESETPGALIEPYLGKLLTLKVSTVAPPEVTVTVGLYTDAGKRESQFKGPGTATFDELAPGNYDVLVQTNDRPPTSSYRRVNLGRDGDDISLQLSRSPQWRVDCLDSRGGPVDSRNFHVFARRKMPAEEQFQPLPCGLSITTPGLWEITAVAPQGWYFAGSDARRSDESYDVDIVNGRSMVNTTVKFSSRPADVKGSVKARNDQSAAGIPVFLIPIDLDLRIRLANGVLQARADPDGNFWFTAIPPGRYEVVATWETTEIDAREWVPGAEKGITVQEGGVEQVEIKIREN